MPPSDQQTGSATSTNDEAKSAATPGFQSVADVSVFLDIPRWRLQHALYSLPEDRRYHSFEIPKRTGGSRQIDAPSEVIRLAQDRLLPFLVSLHRPHPASHGFLSGKSILSNAEPHRGQKLVLNIDLADFFPSINFGRIRGLFMAAPFHMAPAAATVCAQICVHRNGLPQGAPTSPILSNYIASSLDRKLSRIARENGLRYSRFADDITFSTSRAQFPTGVARVLDGPAATGKGLTQVTVGEAVATAISSCGFEVNAKKVRLQTRAVRQSVTGLTVNEFPNVERARIRRIRAMIHAWRKHGSEAAGKEHFLRYATARRALEPDVAARAFRNALYGELAYLKMVRGADNELFLKFSAQLLELDPNPSKFLRQMVFGADDFDVFISHASEDKDAVARPIFEACARAGIKAFLDEAHIGWGENYTTKINTALGAARTVIVIVSADALAKPWPVAEINTALSMEVEGHKTVLPVVVGRPDLTKLPLLRAKNHVGWGDDPTPVIASLKTLLGRSEDEAAPEEPKRKWFGLSGIFKR